MASCEIGSRIWSPSPSSVDVMDDNLDYTDDDALRSLRVPNTSLRENRGLYI